MVIIEPVFKFTDGDKLEEVQFLYVVDYLEEPEMSKRQQYTFSNIKNSVLR